MSNIEEEFFEGKRPWSKLKDQVLEKYLGSYLNIINGLNKTIILVDSFAGPGKFERGGEIGSPLIMCKLADQFVKNKYQVIAVNKSKQHHRQLTTNLQDYIKDNKALPINGKAEDLLRTLDKYLTDQTVFIYLDPFGLRGTSFEIVSKYLQRDQKFSTELLINLSISTIMRYSCIEKVACGEMSKSIQIKHDIITKALGGDYWKVFLLDWKLSPEERRKLIIKTYTEKLREFLPYVGACPVYESNEKSTMKYALFFASRSDLAIKIMNDIMLAAYSKQIWFEEVKGTLFEAINWEDELPPEYYNELERDILEIVKDEEKISRENIWLNLIQKKFMRYLKKHFTNKIKELNTTGFLDYIDVRKTNRINDDSIFYIKEK